MYEVHLCRFCRLLFLLCLPLWGCLQATAEDWTEASRQLAKQIVVSIGKAEITLEVGNRSTLGKDDLDAINSALQQELKRVGLTVAGPNRSGIPVLVTISENIQNYLWVAEVRKDQAVPIILMVDVARSQPASVIREPVALIIRKIELWSQADQILDVGVIDSSPPRLIVLGRNRIAIYGLQATGWHEEHTFTINHSRPWPRDLRGRVLLRRDHLFDAHLPGVSCSSNAGEPLSVTCRESDDPWPLSAEADSVKSFFSPSRNFFTGVLVPGISSIQGVPPFYTAATLPTGGQTRWIFAGIDGVVRSTASQGLQPIVAREWGSDIASVRSGCRAGNQILATGKNDLSSGDSVQAFEVDDREISPVSQSVEFAGSVTAMWTESTGNNVVAVVRNLRTGTYEAFRLAVACGQ